jgi:TP901 family phage tail tape measure protein
MTTGATLKGTVDITTNPARRALQALARDLESYTKLTDRSTSAAKQQSLGFQRMAKSAAILSKANNDAAASQARVNKTLQETKLIAARTTSINSGRVNSGAESAGRVALLDAKRLTEEVRQRVSLQDAAARRQREEQQRLARLERERTAEARRAAVALNAQYQTLTSLRYAMFSVSSEARVFSLALGAAAVASVGIAIAWERDFANVQRTVGGSSDQIRQLRADFVDLAQAIPESWEDLTRIGTLAGQLGIAREYVADFTSVVAKFSTATGVGVEDASTSLGRLNSLLPGVKNNYQGLADAVLNVGINSAATEGQILRVSTQISSVAGAANFSYQQVVGLSGALASIAVPPELSRGVITRVFGQISRSISEGGLNLERFGAIAGLSGDQFAKAWQSDAAGTFLKFMQGVRAQGGDAEAAIRALGITSVRDVPILLRLANAADSTGKAGNLLAEAFDNATNSAGSLNANYGIIADTIAAKLTRLSNSVQALFASGAGGTLGPIGYVLDQLLEKLDKLEAFASTDAGQFIIGIGIALTGLTAAVAGFVAISSAGIAGYAALITALRGLQAVSGSTALTMAGMNSLLAATGPLGAKAAAGIRLLGTAMKVLTAATVVFALPDVFKAISDFKQSVDGIDTESGPTFDRVNKKIGELGSRLRDTPKWAVELGRSFAPLGNLKFGEEGQFNKDLAAADKNIANMVEGGNIDQAKIEFNNLRDAFVEGGGSIEQFNGLFIDSKAAFDAAATGAKTTTEALIALTPEEEAASEAMSALAQVYSDAASTFVDIGGIYESQIAADKKLAQKTADSTKSASDSWQDYFDSFSINVDNYLDNLQKQVDAQNNWEENLLTLASRGASDAVLEQLSSLGVEGAPLVQAFVDGTSDQLAQFEAILADSGGDAVTAFATNMASASPAFWAAANKLGKDAVANIITELATGENSIQGIIDKYNLILENSPVTPQVSATEAKRDLAAIQRYLDSHPLTATGHVKFSGSASTTTTGSAFAGLSGSSINVNSAWAEGGYTGPGAKYQPAGTVHAGEYVFSAAAVRRMGLGTLDQMHAAAKRGYADGGYVNRSAMASSSTRIVSSNDGGTVRLDSYSLKMIQRSGVIVMLPDGKVLASTVNAENKNSNTRGKG